MRNRRVVTVLVGLGLLVSACTGDDSDPGPSRSNGPGSDRPAVLKQVWSEPVADLWNHEFDDSMPWAWTTATDVIVPHDRELVAYSLTTGRRHWSTRLAKPLCGIATRPNAAGVTAVLTGSAGYGNDQCADATAIDTADGSKLWTVSVAKATHYGVQAIEVGPRAIVAFNDCDGAVSLSITDGRRIVTLPTGDRPTGCIDRFASDGTTIIGGHRVGEESFGAWDAATGRRLWRQPLQTGPSRYDASPEPSEVYSSDPLVFGARSNGHTFVRRYDSSSRTVKLIGREQEISGMPEYAGTIGEDFVVQYEDSRLLYAQDAASGRLLRRTVLAAGEKVVGTRGDRVVTLAAAGSAVRDAPLVVRAVDARTGTVQVLGLGRIDGVSAIFGQGLGYDVAVHGDRLLLRMDDRMVAYRLPTRGTPSAPGPKVARGDLDPDVAVDLCPGVTAATKRLLGFPSPGLPAPADCAWYESIGRGVDNHLTLTVTSSGFAAAGKASGTALATKQAQQLAAADEVNRLPALTPVTGLGDQAWAGIRRTAGSSRFGLVRVVVRKANVVIRIGLVGDRLSSAPSTTLAESTRGARAVAADVLAELARRR